MTFSESVHSAWNEYESTGEIQLIFCYPNLGNLEEPIYSYCDLNIFFDESDDDICWELNLDSLDDILPLGEVDGMGFDSYVN